MTFKEYRKLPFPMNLWSVVFDKDLSPEDIPPDWEATLEHILPTLSCSGKYSDKRRESLLYYFKDGYSYSKIGEMYNISGSAIDQHIKSAVRVLRHPSRRNIMLYGIGQSQFMMDNHLGPWQPVHHQEEDVDLSADLESLDQHSLYLDFPLGLSWILSCANIKTIGQLIQLSEAELLSIPQVGPVRVKTIKDLLHKHNLSLSESVQATEPKESKPVEDAPKSVQHYAHWRDVELLPKFSFAQTVRIDNYNTDDISAFIENLIKRTDSKNGKADPFWVKAETALLKACFFYLHSECAPEEQNLANVMRILRWANSAEDQENPLSVLDKMFEDLKDKAPEHIGVQSYAIFMCAGDGKTAQTILITSLMRLSLFCDQYRTQNP